MHHTKNIEKFMDSDSTVRWCGMLARLQQIKVAPARET